MSVAAAGAGGPGRRSAQGAAPTRIVVASGNRGKLAEFERLLGGAGIAELVVKQREALAARLP